MKYQSTFCSVQGIDLFAEPLRNHVPLGLERLRDEPVRRREGLELHDHAADLREDHSGTGRQAWCNTPL